VAEDVFEGDAFAVHRIILPSQGGHSCVIPMGIRGPP
jgi:hypothetical protein